MTEKTRYADIEKLQCRLAEQLDEKLTTSTLSANKTPLRLKRLFADTEIQAAMDMGDMKKAEAKRRELDNLNRTWREFLAVELTEFAFHGFKTSRNSIRKWQKQTFGFSKDAGKLKRFDEFSGTGDPQNKEAEGNPPSG